MTTPNLRDYEDYMRGWNASERTIHCRLEFARRIYREHPDAHSMNSTSLFVNGKGGHEAFIPTHPTIWELAQRYPRRGYWFPGQRRSGRPHVHAGSVSRAVYVLFRAHGIDGSIHRARHTHASTLLRASANIRVVQTLMRHQSLATTALYTEVDEDELRAAVRMLR